MKKLLSVALCLCLVLSLVGCGDKVDDNLVGDVLSGLTGDLTSSDATVLVQNNLDAVYRNTCTKEYMKMVDCDETSVEADYQAGLETEVDFFAYYFGIAELGEAHHERLMAFYDAVYAASDYTLGEVTRNENGSFTIPITVKPIDVITLIYDELMVTGQELLNLYTDEELEAMSDEEYLAYDAQWAELVITTAESKLDSMGYSEPVSVDMQVSKIDGVWQLTSESMEEIDIYIIEYL